MVFACHAGGRDRLGRDRPPFRNGGDGRGRHARARPPPPPALFLAANLSHPAHLSSPSPTAAFWPSLPTAGATVTGQSVNIGAVTYTTAAAAYTVVGWGLFDAITAGTLLYWATVTTLAIAIADQATFAIGGIVITED